MASYVVMQPPAGPASGDERLVRDGFHWLGFLVPPLWLLWHRLWIEAALALAAVLGLSALSAAEGWSGIATGISLAVSIFVGLEGSALRIAALRRRGWREWGVVEAESVADAETRYLAELAQPAEERRPPAVRPAVAARPGHGEAPALGFLGYSGGT